MARTWLGAQKTATTAAPARKNTLTLIGAGSVVSGRIEDDGEIAVWGRVDGEIHAQRVEIGVGAVVRGRITADTVTIYGDVYGPIDSRSIRIGKTGRAKGEARYDVLMIEEGGRIAGDWQSKVEIVPNGDVMLPSHSSTTSSTLPTPLAASIGHHDMVEAAPA